MTWNNEEKEIIQKHPDMHSLTEEQYIQAQESIKFMSDYIKSANKRIAEYLDEIIKERECIKQYEECREYNREIIMMWETLQESKSKS